MSAWSLNITPTPSPLTLHHLNERAFDVVQANPIDRRKPHSIRQQAILQRRKSFDLEPVKARYVVLFGPEADL